MSWTLLIIWLKAVDPLIKPVKTPRERDLIGQTVFSAYLQKYLELTFEADSFSRCIFILSVEQSAQKLHRFRIF